MTRTAAEHDLTADDLYLFAEGTHGRLAEKLGAHLGPGGTSFAVWAPERGARLRDRRLQRLGRLRPSPLARPVLGDLVRRRSTAPGRGRRTSSTSVPATRGFEVDKADPFAFHSELPPRTGSIVWDLGYDWGDADWRSAQVEHDPRSSPLSIYEVHLGSWRRGPDGGWLSYRDLGTAARRPCDRSRLHPHRAAADHGAPVLRFLGLPDDRVLRADVEVRHAAGPDVHDRPPPSARARRDPRLGAVPLPVGRARTRVLRRDAPLRARGPPPRLPPRLAHADLQLRPRRGPELPALQRRPLAPHVSRGRPAGRRRRVDALPRLLEEGGRMGPQRARRPREPRGGVLPPTDERGHLPRAPGGGDVRGGIHRVADGVASHGRGWARLRVQVGHGLDARHAAAPAAGTDPPPLPPRRADVPAGVRVLGELRAPALPRRGGAREGFAPREDAGRRLAAVRQPAAAPRDPLGATGEEAPVHGRRARPAQRVGPRRERPVGAARRAGSRRHPPLGARPERAASRGAGVARARRGSAWLRVDRRGGRRRRDPVLPPAGSRGARSRRRGAQPDPDAARAVPDRPARRRRLARALEQRCRDLRRIGDREPRSRADRVHARGTIASTARRSCFPRSPASSCDRERRDDPRLARIALPAGRDVGRRGRQLLAVLGACDRRRPLPVRPAGRRGGGRAHPADEPDRPPVARLPPRRPAGAPLRLSRPRAVRAARRSPVQPEQAPPRSVRQGDQRTGSVARRGVRLRDRTPGRRPLVRRARQRRLDAEVRGDRYRVHLGRGPATGDTLEPHRDLRDARQGHDQDAPLHPARDPRHLPRPRARPGRGASPVARCHGGRAPARAPVRRRPVSRRTRARELLGLQLDRLLRAAPRVRDALRRSAGLRVQVHGQDPAPRRASR